MNFREENANQTKRLNYFGIKLLVYDDCQKMFEHISQRWTRFLVSRTVRQRPFAIALSGGRAAADLFKIMVFHTLKLLSGIRESSEILKDAHFFWADERCVPPDSPQSNFLTANHNLLQPLKVRETNIHRIRGELNPDEAANIAQEELVKLNLSKKDGIPIIDLVILGMGEDGHTASLFPEELKSQGVVIDNDRIYRPVIASKPPPNRITLGYKSIIKARNVWVVITGKNKQTALANSLPPNCQTPLGIILKNRKDTDIFYFPE